MPRTKQSQVQQPKWTEIFADDTDEAAAPDIPALKKRRLEPSPSHASAAARRPNNDFPSFLSTSSDSSVGSNDNVNLPASRWPKTARKRSSPQQLSPRRDGSASASKWRLQLAKPLSSEKQSSPVATSGGIVQPKGWKTREEMRVIARRHEGTFIQYKVLRRPPDGEWIRDQNYHCNDADMEPRLILPQDLMVQSRFVSKSGNHGGNSYLFLDWKLPGTFLKKRKQHITIFQDTRPKLYTPTSQQQETKGADETAHPMLFLDPELAADEVDMITKFIQDAPAGSSPREFFRNCHDKLLLATPAREARNWDEEESTQMEEEGEEETADNVKRAASEWQEGENVHINDTTMMASEEDEVAPDTTLNNNRFLQNVFRDLSPAPELGASTHSPTPRPPLTEGALVAHQRRWSSSAPGDQVKRMLNWSNESNLNSDADLSRMENRLRLDSVKQKPQRVAIVAKPKATVRPAKETRTSSNKLHDFSMLRVVDKESGASNYLPSQAAAKRGRLVVTEAKNRTTKSSGPRNLDTAFANADDTVVTLGALNLAKSSLNQIALADECNGLASMARDAAEDDVLPYPDDWNDPFANVSVDAASPATKPSHFQTSSSDTFDPASKIAFPVRRKACVKAHKSGRNAIGSRVCLGLLILCILPLASKYSGDGSVKAWFQDLMALRKTWNSSISMLRIEEILADGWKSFGNHVDLNTISAPLESFKTDEPKPSIPLFLPYHSPQTSAKSFSTSAAGSTRFERWPSGLKLGQFLGLGFTSLLLSSVCAV